MGSLLTTKPLMLPPLVVMSAAVKPLGTSEKVKLIVAVSPAFKELALLLIATVGARVRLMTEESRRKPTF